jgi:hypothetical protein
MLRGTPADFSAGVGKGRATEVIARQVARSRVYGYDLPSRDIVSGKIAKIGEDRSNPLRYTKGGMRTDSTTQNTEAKIITL